MESILGSTHWRQISLILYEGIYCSSAGTWFQIIMLKDISIWFNMFRACQSKTTDERPGLACMYSRSKQIQSSRGYLIWLHVENAISCHFRSCFCLYTLNTCFKSGFHWFSFLEVPLRLGSPPSTLVKLCPRSCALWSQPHAAKELHRGYPAGSNHGTGERWLGNSSPN